jgi:predicted GTPase
MKKIVKLKESDLVNIIKRVIKEQEVDEDRLDFGNMSDDELHSLHPHVKKHPKHFKDFSPTSEYLGWKGEVSKRNMYKRYGKFHNAFDKEK